MTQADREQKAREWVAAHELAFEKDIVDLIELLADTERATLERVYKFVTNDRFTRTTKVTVTDIEDWLRQRIKEIQP